KRARENARRRAERARRRKTPLHISRPWQAAGISRATWYARGGRAGQMSPTPYRVSTRVVLVSTHRGSVDDVVTYSELVIDGRETPKQALARVHAKRQQSAQNAPISDGLKVPKTKNACTQQTASSPQQVVLSMRFWVMA